jgi:hypothetical protein
VTLAWIEASGRPCILISRANTGTALVTAGIDRIMWMMRPSTLDIVTALNSSAVLYVGTGQCVARSERVHARQH